MAILLLALVLVRRVILIGMSLSSLRPGCRDRCQSMPEYDQDIHLIPIGSEEGEANVTGDPRFGQTSSEHLSSPRAADVAAGDRVHRLVALVDHERVLSGQKLLDRAVDDRLTDQHLIGRVRIDTRGRGDRRIVEIDAATHPVEAKRNRS
jgi:hypothetical protein